MALIYNPTQPIIPKSLLDQLLQAVGLSYKDKTDGKIVKGVFNGQA